jgi:hypothetical protein
MLLTYSILLNVAVKKSRSRKPESPARTLPMDGHVILANSVRQILK